MAERCGLIIYVAIMGRKLNVDCGRARLDRLLGCLRGFGFVAIVTKVVMVGAAANAQTSARGCMA